MLRVFLHINRIDLYLSLTKKKLEFIKHRICSTLNLNHTQEYTKK